MTDITLRPAEAGDAALILALLQELAAYEKLLQGFRLDEAQIARDMLGPDPACHCVLAFVDGEPAGIATWVWTYKSFRAARGIFLEDLFVRPAWRGRGAGRMLLAHLADRARQANGFVEWQVLDWNTPSIDFYKKIGAQLKPEWIPCRLEGEALAEMTS